MALWRHLIGQTLQTLPPAQRLWRDLRILAVDATTLTLPESLWLRFGAHRGSRGNGPVQSHSLFVYDVLARLPIQIKMGRVCEDERPMLRKLLSRIVSPGTALIMDSIFYSFALLTTLQALGGHWIVPVRSSAKPTLLEQYSFQDGLYQILNRQKTPGLPACLTIRIVTVSHPGFRPRRIATSLIDPVKYPAEEIAALYHQRWHIETFFREFKYVLGAQSWHAQTLHAFYVEVLFLILLTCLTRLVMADSKIPPHQLSFSKSFAWVQRLLILSAFVSIEHWELLYQHCLSHLSFCRIDFRPHRSFERDTQRRRAQRRQRMRQSFTGTPHAA